MDRAAEVLVDALVADRSLTVFADYDVDGAASAAQLVRWFRHMGKTMPIYVPDRLREGYGPTPESLKRLRDQGVELVVTVDCGSSADQALSAAREVGLQVIVIDHHLMSGAAPEDVILVNPNHADCRSGQGALAAAGVTFVLLIALNREARRRGLFATRKEPDLRAWSDLAALGAICDVTTLQGFNRALTAQGLATMSRWLNPGLAALLASAGQAPAAASVFHAGFILGPRINAGGRIGKSDLGARLLCTDDPEEAATLAAELEALNNERRRIEREIADEAALWLERKSNFDASAPAIVVAREDWHAGVIGIVASRLRERYRRPVVVIGLETSIDLGRGSGRSQPGVNLGRAVQKAKDAGLLLSGGGHAMAAGLTLRSAQIPEFRDFLCDSLASEMADAEARDFVEIDALVSVGAANRGLVEAFAGLAPFGPGNPEPRLAFAAVRPEHAMVLKGGHIRCTLSDGGPGRLSAVCWRAEGTPMASPLLSGGASHMAGRLSINEWQGRKQVQLEIDDIAEARSA